MELPLLINIELNSAWTRLPKSCKGCSKQSGNFLSNYFLTITVWEVHSIQMRRQTLDWKWRVANSTRWSENMHSLLLNLVFGTKLNICDFQWMIFWSQIFLKSIKETSKKNCWWSFAEIVSNSDHLNKFQESFMFKSKLSIN